MVHGGGALRDMTRIAGSDPLMWTDISVTNQTALLNAIDGFQDEMSSLRDLIISAMRLRFATTLRFVVPIGVHMTTSLTPSCE